MPFAGCASSSGDPAPVSQSETAVNLQVSCRQCGGDMTPVHLHVTAYFTKFFSSKPAENPRDNRRIQPNYYGEALTRDEVIERLEKKEEEKQVKLGKKRKRPEPTDPITTGNYKQILEFIVVI